MRKAVVLPLVLALLAVLVGAFVLVHALSAPPPAAAPEIGRERGIEATAPGGEGKPPDSVTVFYATDRARFTPGPKWYLAKFLWPLSVFSVGAFLLKRLRRVLAEPFRWRATALRWALVACVAALTVHGAYDSFRMWKLSERLDVLYGGERLQRTSGPGLPAEVGICQVTIPPGHVLGEVERPSPWRGDFFEDPQKHMVVHGVDAQEEAQFFRGLQEVVQGSTNEDAFVFVHGYNVTFEEAVLRTAQIAYDLKFEGAPICWSWPSQGGYQQYPVDEANVRWSTAHLERFLLALRERSGAKRIHLIGHSMGNRALTEALQRLGAKSDGKTPLFRQIVLAAPDLDADTFREDIAPAILPAAERVTLYASSKDAALLLSREIHGNARAGEAGENLVVVEGMDTIDVSAVSGSHSYIGNNGRVLGDLGVLLKAGERVEKRGGLVQRTARGLRYWLLERLGD